MWEYSAGDRRGVIFFSVLFAVANAVVFLEPIIVARAINIVQDDIVQHNLVTYGGFLHACWWLSLLVMTEIIFWSCHGPARILERNNAFRVRVNYKKYLLGGILNFPMQWHVEHHTGDTIDKVEKGASAIFKFSEDGFEIIETIALLIGSFIALIYFNPYSSYMVISMALVAAVIVIKFDKVLIPQYGVLNRMENKISERIIDTITNIGTIVILRVEKCVLGALGRKIAEPFRLYKQNSRENELKWFLVSIITALSMVWVLASYIYHGSVTHSVIAFGTLTALYQYTDRINTTFFRFAWMYSEIVRQRASVANAEEIASEFTAREKVQPVDMNSSWGELEIKSLSFSYHTEEGADLHLDNISLNVRRGERIALIGETGTGKSTLLKIVRDLYTPRTLELYLDGRIVPDGFKSISASIALIPQDPEILSTTIGDNVTLGVECDMTSMLKYTNLACFTDVALGLPRGFDSMVKERGVNLSGGEKQRLALARGLMASEDKAIILLDEPTSSVDVANEQKIFENIFTAFADKTLICSLHSLHLLPLFDCIYLFDDGRIIASGAFSELLESSDEFKKLWDDFIKNRDTGGTGIHGA